MAELDWRQLLDDPEIEGIIRRVRNGPGLRLYRSALAFDDLESWLYDEAVRVAVRYARTTFNDTLYDARRHWQAWLYVALKNAVINGRHLRSFEGAAKDSPKWAAMQAAGIAISIEKATEMFGDSLANHIHEPTERTWGSEPIAQLLRLERLERLEERVRREPRQRFVTESCGICTENLCTSPVFTAASGLCAKHYGRQRGYDRLCSVEGCTGGEKAGGLCGAHWRAQREADPATPRCSEPDCGRPVECRGMCRTHYKRAQRTGGAEAWAAQRAGRSTVCVVPGCDRPVKAHDQCETHYSREKRARKRGAAS